MVSISNMLSCTNLYRDSAKVYSSAVESWSNEQVLKIECCKPQNIYNADVSGLIFRLPSNKMLASRVEPCNHGTNSNMRIKVLLACNADGTEELPPLVNGNSE
jgi:hypothetical protein